MTDIAKIRLIIGDNNPGDYHFTEAELQFFFDSEGSVNLASAKALEAWAADYAKNPSTEKIGDYSYGQTTTKDMLALAKQLRETDAETPAMTWAEL